MHFSRRITLYFSILLLLSNAFLPGLSHRVYGAVSSITTEVNNSIGGIEVISADSVIENGRVKVTATIKNNSSSSQNAGVVVIGSDAGGKPLETKESHEENSWGNPISIGPNVTKTLSVYLDATSIESVRVMPTGNSKTITLLSQAFREENGKVIVTGVVENGTGQLGVLSILAKGKDSSGKVIEVGADYSKDATWGTPKEIATKSSYNFQLELNSGSIINQVEVSLAGQSSEVELLSYGFYKKDGKVTVTGVVENGTNVSKALGLSVTGIDAEGKYIEAKSSFTQDNWGKAKLVNPHIPASFTITLDAGDQIVDLLPPIITGKQTETNLISYGVKKNKDQIIVTGVVENGSTANQVLEIQAVTLDGAGHEIESIIKRSKDTFNQDKLIEPGVPFNFSFTFNELNVRKVKIDIPNKISNTANTVLVNDTTAPKVISSAPLMNATNVDVKSAMKISFNEDLMEGSEFTTINLSDSNGNVIPTTNRLVEKELVVVPVKPLSFAQTYKLQIPKNAIADFSGNSLDEYGITFTTSLMGKEINDYEIIQQSTTWNSNQTINKPLIIGPNATLTINSGVTVTLMQDMIVYGKVENNGTINAPSRTIFANFVQFSWGTSLGDPDYTDQGVINPAGGMSVGRLMANGPDSYPIPPITIDSPLDGTEAGTTSTLLGKTVAGFSVILDNQEVIADANGAFSIPVQLSKGENDLYFQLKDNFNRIHTVKQLTLNVGNDTALPEAPTVHEVTDQTTSVIGTTLIGSEVTLKIGDNYWIGIADGEGKFSITIPKQPAGTIIEVTAKDSNGKVSEVTKVTVLSSESSNEGTVVRGDITDDTVWTLDKSPYLLEGKVRVQSGATLTIEPGVIVRGTGDWYKNFEINGHVKAIGEKSANITFENVYLWNGSPQESSGNGDIDIEIRFAQMGTAPIEVGKGRVILTDSALSDTRIDSNYSTSDIYVERNTFSGGSVSIWGHSPLHTVYVTNNLFYGGSPFNSNTRYFTGNVVVELNSFVGVTNGYIQGSNLANNYWDTIDEEKIKSKFENQNIIFKPYLTVPHKDTPTVELFMIKEIPLYGANEISPYSIFTIEFTQDIKEGENFHNISFGGPTVSVPLEKKIVENKLILTPSNPLMPGAQYQVYVPQRGILSIDGKEAYIPENGPLFSFTTRTQTAPKRPVIDEVNDQTLEIVGSTDRSVQVNVNASSKTYTAVADDEGIFNIAIDAQKAGTILTIVATDSVGNVSEAAYVMVKDITPPDAPKVNPVGDSDTAITGTAEAGGTVKVYSGDSLLGSGIANKEGIFQFYLDTQKADTELIVTVTDQAGLVSAATKVSVIDNTAPNAPVVTKVTDQSMNVLGTAEKGSEVVVRAGSAEWKGTSNEEGKFAIAIPKQVAGTVIEVTAKDGAGNISGVTKVTVVDETAPTAPVVEQVTDQSETVTGTAEIGSEIVVKTGSTSWKGTANEQGKFSITIPKQVAGTVIEVTAKDGAGNVSAITKVTVVDETRPTAPVVYKVTDQSVSVTGTAEIGSEIVVKTGSASWKGTANEQGKFSITIPKQVAGTVIEVTAKDGAGNISAVTKVTVEDETAPNAPVVNKVTDQTVTVTGTAEIGSEIVVKIGSTSWKGTANEQGKFSITIPKQVVGTFIEVTAKDGAGNVSVITKVTVIDETAPTAPVVNKVTDQSVIVTGTAEVGLEIAVKIGSVGWKGTVNENGKFTITIPKQAAGTVIEVTAIDGAGNVSAVTKVTVEDETAPNAPVVNKVTDQSITVTGTAEIDSEVTIKIGSANWIGSADEAGKFTITVPKQAAGTVIEVTAKDGAGNVSAITKVTVEDETAPTAPVVNKVTDQTVTLTGTVEIGSEVVVKIGSTSWKGTANEQGKFSITIPKQAAGTVIEVTAKDGAGNISPVTKVTVVDETAPTAPMPNKVTDQSVTVKGTAEIGTEITIKIGSASWKGITNAEGVFSITIPKQTAGTVIEVTAKDEAGNVSAITKITVEDETAPTAPVVNKVSDQTVTLTGTAEIGSEVVVKIGSTSWKGTANEQGKFSITIPKQTAGTVIEVTAKDGAGNVSAVTKVTVEDETAPTAPVVNKVSDQTVTLTGTAEIGSEVVVKIGSTSWKGTANADGKFSITIPKQTAGTVIEVTAKDKAGNVSAITKITVEDETAPTTPVVNKVSDQTVTLTGTAEIGSEVVVKIGSTSWKGTANEEGEFSIAIPKQAAGTVIEVTAKDEAGNISTVTKVIVEDETAPMAPVVNKVTDQSVTLTGTSEVGSEVTVIIGNSSWIVTANAEGKFSITIPKQAAGTVIKVTAKDRAGNISTITKATVVDETAPTVPVVDTITDKSVVVTGTAEAGSEVTVKIGNASWNGTATAEGKFSITIPIQASGTVIEVSAKDKAGNISAVGSAVVVDGTSPGAPTVAEVTEQETVLTGSAEQGSTVIAKVSGVEIGRGVADSNGKFSITIPAQTFGKVVEVYAIDKTGNVSVPAKVTVQKKLVTLIGDTRYATAAKVSKTGWETAESVLLVNGFAIVDGLTATPLAAAKNAPILLTTADSIPQVTLDELARLKTKEITLIGGEAVISPKVESTLKAKGYKVTRIGGLNRKDTSLLIAKELDKLVDVNSVYVAYSFGEPDALSISAQAGLKKQPIILVDKTTVPTETLTWLKNEQLTDAYFIGGEAVIASAIINQIDKITTENVLNNRLSGTDRHETNAKVISKFYPETNLQSILVAKSETVSLVDALTAGPLAAKLGSPVVLVSSAYGMLSSQKLALAGKHTKYVHQIGGGVNLSALKEVSK